MRAVALLLGGLIMAGCAMGSSESAAPLVVRGTVVDESGTPVDNVRVVLNAFDAAGAGGGPDHFTAEVTTAPDGTFEFRFPPPTELSVLAANNRGMVGFGLIAQVAPNLVGRGDFTRQILGTTWGGEPPTVVMRPDVVAP